MKITLQSLAELVGATVQGDLNCEIEGVATLESAKSGELAFFLDPSYRDLLQTTKASAVLLSEKEQNHCSVNMLFVKNTRYARAKIFELFLDKKKNKFEKKQGYIDDSAVIEKTAQIAKTATIRANCYIGAHTVIDEGVFVAPGVVIGENCQIGRGTQIHSNVVFYDRVKVGAQCRIKGGAVIGGEGFGFAQHEGSWIKTPHLGGVLIGDCVEIGANTAIDCGLLEDTSIDSGVIIDNLVQIAHNVCIGENTAIAGCVGIAGSTKIGKRCLIGGGAGLAGHLKITDDVHITGTSAVHRSIEASGVYSSGLPATSSKEWKRNVARFQSLDRLGKRLKNVEDLIDLKEKG
jgi:UDP-3-O-[3-hydroxymyristoyl] glucosamine N-acyltransferase